MGPRLQSAGARQPGSEHARWRLRGRACALQVRGCLAASAAPKRSLRAARVVLDGVRGLGLQSAVATMLRPGLFGSSRCYCGLRRRLSVQPVAASLTMAGARHASTQQPHLRKRRRRGTTVPRGDGSTQEPPCADARAGQHAMDAYREQRAERWTPERQGVVSMAPFVPTPSLGVSAALRLLAMSAERGDVFIDLGCGDGRLVAAAYAPKLHELSAR